MSLEINGDEVSRKKVGLERVVSLSVTRDA